MISRAGTAVLTTVAMAVAGCGGRAPERSTAEQKTEPLVGGTPISAGYDYIVRVTPVGEGECTGVLLAPNLVLTVRHCVGATQIFGLLDCDPLDPFKTVATIGATYDNIEIYREYTRGDTPVAKATKVFAPANIDLCAQDIALLLLDRDVPLSAPPPIHLTPDSDLTLGEELFTAGWGVTDAKGTPTDQLLERDGELLVVGPATYRREPYPELRVMEGLVLTEAGNCGGDSGAPVMRKSTGGIIALGHLAYNLDFSKAGIKDFLKPWLICDGDTAVSTMVSTAFHKEVIMQAFAESGYAPRLDGRPPPSGLGGTCEIDADCHSGICITYGEDRYCSQSCEETACPDTYSCATTADSRQLCISDAVTRGDESCNFAAAPNPSHRWLVGLTLAAIAAVSRRSRRA